MENADVEGDSSALKGKAAWTPKRRQVAIMRCSCSRLPERLFSPKPMGWYFVYHLKTDVEAPKTQPKRAPNGSKPWKNP